MTRFYKRLMKQLHKRLVTRFHRRCGSVVVFDDSVTDGYDYVCLECDEDLYVFETYVSKGE